MKTLLVVSLCLLAGCGVLDYAVGIREDGTPMEGPSIVDTVGNAANGLLGPYGAIVGLVLGWGAREYRHYRLIQAGKKDEDRDGVEDKPATPA